MGFLRHPLYWLYERRLERELDGRDIPRHVGVILDGNRRWARTNGLSDVSTGHERGADKIFELLGWCDELRTLERAALVRGATFSKTYSTRDGSAGVNRSGATSWSATDLGRLLVWRRIGKERSSPICPNATAACPASLPSPR
jgi:hypothetical protein